MTERINVFIPAAGLGERLRPITFYIPKPLLPVAGRPVLELVLERISMLAVGKIGINLNYKGDVIEDWIDRSVYREKIILYPEEPVLGIGGALKNAESLLSEGTFLVHNADILSEINLERVVEFHRSSGNIATLAVHDLQEFNTVATDADGLFKGVGNSLIKGLIREKRVAFTGIAVYNPEFLGFLPEGGSSVVDAWLAVAASGGKIGTFEVNGSYWSDMGTPSAYAAAVIHAMRTEGETVFIHPSAGSCRHARMDGYVLMEEGSAVSQGSVIRNCILLPGSRAEKNATLENCIVGPDFVVAFGEVEILGSYVDEHLLPIGTGGSDRRYYRVKEERGTSVLMRFSGANEDFDRHVSYTDFFRKCGIPVPGLMKAYSGKGEALFEDLGDLSLYGWLKCPRPEDEVEAMFRSVIDIVVMLHSVATLHVSECPLLKERIFDYDHLRWETGYFVQNYVSGIRHIRIGDAASLSDEFHRLAMKVISFPTAVIHRDLQSQNIMVTKGAPRLIDYQGARIGAPAYDMASLLWDPYYRIEDSLRERLLNYYVKSMQEKSGPGFDGSDFRGSLLPCRLQRHMQALGAYGFLSSAKGKKYFLKHAVEGLRLLKEDISAVKDEYPGMYEIICAL